VSKQLRYWIVVASAVFLTAAPFAAHSQAGNVATDLSASDSEACGTVTSYFSEGSTDVYGSKYCSVKITVTSVPSTAWHGHPEEVGQERPYLPSDMFLCGDLREAAFHGKPIYVRVYVSPSGDTAPGTGYIQNYVKQITVDNSTCAANPEILRPVVSPKLQKRLFWK